MTQEVYSVLKHYDMNDKQKEGIIEIWEFLSRFALVLAEDYNDQPLRDLKVDDFKLITYKIVNTKMGNIKEITSKKDMPFRTQSLFNNYFSSLGKASLFFHNQNRANGIKWLMDKVISEIPARWVLSDYVQQGLIAHISAIDANYSSNQPEDKRFY